MKYIYQHLGLGDHLICNGLIRNITNNEEEYTIFCKNHNLESIVSMYGDIKNVIILPMPDDLQVIDFLKNIDSNNIIDIGHGMMYHYMVEHSCTWDESFYKQMKVNFEERWNSFKYIENSESQDELFKKLNPENKKYVLIHNKDSSGMDRIDYSKIDDSFFKIFVIKTGSIFDYVKLIENANEIHCVDSSFKHLVESVDTAAKLIYHRDFIPKHGPEMDHKYKKNWIVI